MRINLDLNQINLSSGNKKARQASGFMLGMQYIDFNKNLFLLSAPCYSRLTSVYVQADCQGRYQEGRDRKNTRLD